MNILQTKSTSILSRYQHYWVWIRIFLHVIVGVCKLSLLFPFLNSSQKKHRIQLWSQFLLKILQIRLQVQGADQVVHGPYLIASNHISWLDIHVINTFKPVRFVAKSEVRGWPVFGWMAEQLGTVFIRRDSARHARQVVDQIAEVLRFESVCIFPEGTSTAGQSVLPFKPNLFESAIVAKAVVLPIAIIYRSSLTGARSDIPAFIGDMGLLKSMSKIIENRFLVAQIILLDPSCSSQTPDMDRKQLASFCQESIARVL
jgi:1-acyl-sn-glycerol-3-phosphate acyltransferase